MVSNSWLVECSVTSSAPPHFSSFGNLVLCPWYTLLVHAFPFALAVGFRVPRPSALLDTLSQLSFSLIPNLTIPNAVLIQYMFLFCWHLSKNCLAPQANMVYATVKIFFAIPLAGLRFAGRMTGLVNGTTASSRMVPPHAYGGAISDLHRTRGTTITQGEERASTLLEDQDRWQRHCAAALSPVGTRSLSSWLGLLHHHPLPLLRFCYHSRFCYLLVLASVIGRERVLMKF